MLSCCDDCKFLRFLFFLFGCQENFAKKIKKRGKFDALFEYLWNFSGLLFGNKWRDNSDFKLYSRNGKIVILYIKGGKILKN